MSDGLETHRPPGQLEHPHDPGDPEHLHDPPEGPQVGGPLPLRWEDEQVEVVGEDSEHVHHIHGAAEEGQLGGGPGQPQEELQGEQGDADRLHLRRGSKKWNSTCKVKDDKKRIKQKRITCG